MDKSYTTRTQLQMSLQRVADKIESVEDDISSLQTQVDGISVPTKMSELTNDSGYIKSVNGKSANVAGAISLVPPDIGAAGNRNLLDNWYLVEAINQRGQTEYTATGYSIDRWILGTGGSNRVIVNSDSVTLSMDTVGDFLEYVDLLDLLKGEVVTISALTVDGELYTVTGTIPNVVSVSTSLCIINIPGFGTFRLAVSSSKHMLFVAFRRTESGRATISLSAVKMELGPTQTLARRDASGNWVLNDPPPNKALELAKCQRYQLVIQKDSRFPSTMENSINMQFIIPTPVSMRAVPTVNADSMLVEKKSGEALSGYGFSVGRISSNAITVVASKTSITDQNVVVQAIKPIIFDANL